MGRLKSLVAAAAAVTLWPMAATAQPAAKPARICFVEFESSKRFDVFFETMRSINQAGGRLATIDRRSAEGRPERYPELVRDCLRAQSDVIVVQTTPAAQAAKEATSTVPIVMLSMGDPL